jgi:hypothetical protein
MGVFLGTYSGQDLGADDNKMYACFAATNPFGLTTACSFPTKGVAQTFIEETFAPARRRKLSVESVETDSEFPSVVDIIKSGYLEHTHGMIDELFNEADQTLH